MLHGRIGTHEPAAKPALHAGRDHRQSDAVMRPALLTMSNPTTPTASRQRNPRQIGHDHDQASRADTATIRNTGSFPNRSASPPISGAPKSVKIPPVRKIRQSFSSAHAHIRHEREADVRNDRETAEHHGRRQPERNQVPGLAKGLDRPDSADGRELPGGGARAMAA